MRLAVLTFFLTLVISNLAFAQDNDFYMVDSEDLQTFDKVNPNPPKKLKKERKSLKDRTREARKVRTSGKRVKKKKSRLNTIEKLVRNEERARREKSQDRKRDLERWSIH